MSDDLGPNARRRYAPLSAASSSSTANLLPPSTRQTSNYSSNPPSIRIMASNSSLNSVAAQPPRESSVMTTTEKFAFSPDPYTWGADLSAYPEADDKFHNPDPKRDHKTDNKTGTIFTWRGVTNLGCLALLGFCLLGLFAGYPITTYIIKLHHPVSYMDGFNIGGINSTGQVPDIGNWGLIDVDTPLSLHTRASYIPGNPDMQLVFSDEFNQDGRTFYPGDDPFWTADDLHYWQTGNLEWYDPTAIITKNGYLDITLSERPAQGLKYQGGMMTTWNKFCFTGGLIETSVSIPGTTNILGLWPAVWTMGNLGRAGYGASLEGMWPYSYDSCDVGTLKNQTLNGNPIAATQGGSETANGPTSLSFLPGQRLSRCTCVGEEHPGPVHSDGTYVGRSAPEIDIFEAQVDPNTLVGKVSQSAQWAPYDNEYIWFKDDPTTHTVFEPNATKLNGYFGAVFQQTTSALTLTNQDCYELKAGCFSTYGFDYKGGFDGAYIAWIADGKLTWSHNAAAVGADTITEISARPIPVEPMYIIMNLGMSTSFGPVDEINLTFPTTMRVDWVRVYQYPDAINIGCDPPDFPTADYIQNNLPAYMNPLLTTWRDDYKKPFPKNNLIDTC